jgi:hypothetical protein
LDRPSKPGVFSRVAALFRLGPKGRVGKPESPVLDISAASRDALNAREASRPWEFEYRPTPIEKMEHTVVDLRNPRSEVPQPQQSASVQEAVGRSTSPEAEQSAGAQEAPGTSNVPERRQATKGFNAPWESEIPPPGPHEIVDFRLKEDRTITASPEPIAGQREDDGRATGRKSSGRQSSGRQSSGRQDTQSSQSSLGRTLKGIGVTLRSQSVENLRHGGGKVLRKLSLGNISTSISPTPHEAATLKELAQGFGVSKGELRITDVDSGTAKAVTEAIRNHNSDWRNQQLGTPNAISSW